MFLIVCVDDNWGMAFNSRRQSKDRLLRKHILEKARGTKLWMNEYTRKQFEEELDKNVIVDEEFLDKAEPGDMCFVENIDISKYEDKIERIILYKWNRAYPSDIKFHLDEEKWQPSVIWDFAGSSHERITEEVYVHV